MMKSSSTLSIIVVFLFSAACSELTDPNVSPNLFGAWEYQNWEDQVITMRRVTALPEDNSGFIIYDNGKFMERKNSGWCGTPPIAYKNYDGTWERLADNEFAVTVGYWGGTEFYRMKIVEISFNEMKYIHIYEPVELN